MSEVFQPIGMRDVNEMVQTINDVLSPVITIIHDKREKYGSRAVNKNGNTVLGTNYYCGRMKPDYPMPATIGFTSDSRYQFDTRIRMDGMPLFRGYTWDKWYASSPFKID